MKKQYRLLIETAEEWRPVVGYEGYYEISSIGNIRSLDRYVFNKGNQSNSFIKGKPLMSMENKYGYYMHCLYKDGRYKNVPIHRMVALAFLQNTDNEPQINHKDGNKKNNRVENLEWVSPSKNVQHAYDTQLNTCVSIRHYKAVIITYNNMTMNVLEWSQYLNIKPGTLYSRVRRWGKQDLGRLLSPNLILKYAPKTRSL